MSAEHRIELMGDIWANGWTLERFNNELRGADTPKVVIDLKSLGGDIMEAYAIYDAIKSLSARVVVNIVGSSASAATVIASAADEVTITENSRYLVHNARTWVEGTAEKLGQAFEMLRSIDEQIVNTYVKRTGKPRAALEDLMKQERWLTAQEALDWGFVDKIVKPKIENKMTAEEQAALQAENEQLKAQLEELRAALEALQAEKAAAEEKEIEEEIEAHIVGGRITADVKAFWVNAYKADRKTATAAIEAIKVVDIAKVPQPTYVATKTQAWEDFKAGKINAEQYLKIK